VVGGNTIPDTPYFSPRVTVEGLPRIAIQAMSTDFSRAATNSLTGTIRVIERIKVARAHQSSLDVALKTFQV